MDVTDSDHKPVRCIFTVDIARVDESVRRQELGEILNSNKKIKCMLEELYKIPETIVSTNNIILQNKDTSILRITNKSGKKDALFEITCEGQSTIRDDGLASDHCPKGSFGFPLWLEVTYHTTKYVLSYSNRAQGEFTSKFKAMRYGLTILLTSRCLKIKMCS